MSTPETTAPAGRALVRTRHPGIFKRGERYVVRFRDPSGKQRQRAARTLAEARRLRSELGADVSRGEYRPDSKVTFAAYAERWRESYAGRTARGLRPETRREYARDLRPAIERLGRMRLAEITPADVREFARALEAEGLRPATVRRRLAPVKAMLATAVEDGLLRANPTAGVRIGSPVTADYEDDELVKALTVDQLARLVEEVPEGWRRLLVATLAQTGLRISEALGLRWADVDKRGRLMIRRRVRDGEVGATKSRQGRREVPIAPALARELAAHRLASPWSADDDYVFSAEVGGPIMARNLYRWLAPAAERAGVGWAGFHTLRHTAASRWLLSGVSIAQVSRLLGHADPGFTLRVYVSVLPTDVPDGEALAAAVGLR
jgi:integrase